MQRIFHSDLLEDAAKRQLVRQEVPRGDLKVDLFDGQVVGVAEEVLHHVYQHRMKQLDGVIRLRLQHRDEKLANDDDPFGPDVAQQILASLDHRLAVLLKEDFGAEKNVSLHDKKARPEVESGFFCKRSVRTGKIVKELKAHR